MAGTAILVAKFLHRAEYRSLPANLFHGNTCQPPEIQLFANVLGVGRPAVADSPKRAPMEASKERAWISC